VGEESRTGRRRRRSLIEAALALMALAVLLGLSLRALVPFLGAFLWAAVLSVFGWPLVARLRRATGMGLTPAAALVALGYTLLLAYAALPPPPRLDRARGRAPRREARRGVKRAANRRARAAARAALRAGEEG
jgi:hypothetical protein